MARRPKPWYRKARGAWFAQINGQQVKEAYDRFYALMRQPQTRKVSPHSLAAIIDAFLDWTQRQRSEHTYEAYRYRLQRFIEQYPDLRPDEMRPYHVETWADAYPLSITSRRNYLRAVKRCMKWARKQGYIDINPISDLEVPAGEAKEVYVSPDEFRMFLAYARNRWFVDLLEVTYDAAAVHRNPFGSLQKKSTWRTSGGCFLSRDRRARSSPVWST